MGNCRLGCLDYSAGSKGYRSGAFHSLKASNMMKAKKAQRQRRIFVLGLLSSIVALGSTAVSTVDKPSQDSEWNVILVTWDGIRRHEFEGFPDSELSDDDHPLLPYFWRELYPLGRLYGDPHKSRPMLVANTTLVSLPAYHSIMTGQWSNCFSNQCGRVAGSTFLERIRWALQLSRKAVASISSWNQLGLAVARQPDDIFINTGLEPLRDGLDDQYLDKINQEQVEDPPTWASARLDRYTHAHALRYLRVHKPRFLHIGFNDADEWAHAGNYQQYIAAIRRYDVYLRELVEELANLSVYGEKTCILVTTDHGRGVGAKWTRHSNGEPTSAQVFLYAGCPTAKSSAHFIESPKWTSHLDIRPTIESIFGLQPKTCTSCGQSLHQQSSASDPK